jgi:hypothetical protein
MDRPPGITNQEYRCLQDEVAKVAFSYQGIGTMLYGQLSQLMRKYFIEIPTSDRAYVNEDYVLSTMPNLITSENLSVQKAKCQVCGENRGVDVAHIIPRNITGGLMKCRKQLAKPLIGDSYRDNVFVVCPNHHRFFDRGLLHKSEFEKLDASDRPSMIRHFFEMVLRGRQNTFWQEGRKPGEVLYSEDKNGVRFIQRWYLEYGIDEKELLSFL